MFDREKVNNRMKFDNIDVKVKDLVPYSKYYELEQEIAERVLLTRFKKLEGNMGDYLRIEDFKVTKKEQEKTLADLFVKIRPLASVQQVDQKVEETKRSIEAVLDGVSKKCDCAADKQEAMKFTEKLRNLVK